MTFKKLPVHAANTRHIAVIGGGLFGVMTALKLAERGFLVTIFESKNDIILGASYINQNRLHMGYHYPRSYETVKSSLTFQKAFCSMFSETVVDNFDHYYCVAKSGSLLSGSEYINFCDKLGLPYIKEFPKTITLSKEIELCIKVPEKLYDANLLRKSLRMALIKYDTITLLLSTDVVNITTLDDGFEIHYKSMGKTKEKKYDAVVNATYSNINIISGMANFETKKYQYELCEVMIVKAPWVNRTGCAIMDGPFFGILPFGFSEDYMLYDVDLSVLERSYGKTPEFEHDISYYDRDGNRRDRFKKMIEKAKKYIAEMENCRYLYSVYETRMVLPNREGDDARPTEIISNGKGFWSVFSGKVTASIPAAEKIAEEIYRHFNNKAV
ncbi:MAG: FAD-dependent oxidoreductase [Candidatus Aenigmarchaeota archaeon]|nr:FAD-dependent oxidoreductase [Candidatus Aenigmarchaeota archaeon]